MEAVEEMEVVEVFLPEEELRLEWLCRVDPNVIRPFTDLLVVGQMKADLLGLCLCWFSGNQSVIIDDDSSLLFRLSIVSIVSSCC